MLDLDKGEIVKVNYAGRCPVCGSEDLLYGGSRVDGDFYYEFGCSECGAKGKEWYKLEYLESRAYPNV